MVLERPCARRVAGGDRRRVVEGLLRAEACKPLAQIDDGAAAVAALEALDPGRAHHVHLGHAARPGDRRERVDDRPHDLEDRPLDGVGAHRIDGRADSLGDVPVEGDGPVRRLDVVRVQRDPLRDAGRQGCACARDHQRVERQRQAQLGRRVVGEARPVGDEEVHGVRAGPAVVADAVRGDLLDVGQFLAHVLPGQHVVEPGPEVLILRRGEAAADEAVLVAADGGRAALRHALEQHEVRHVLRQTGAERARRAVGQFRHHVVQAFEPGRGQVVVGHAPSLQVVGEDFARMRADAGTGDALVLLRLLQGRLPLLPALWVVDLLPLAEDRELPGDVVLPILGAEVIHQLDGARRRTPVLGLILPVHLRVHVAAEVVVGQARE